MEISSHNSLIRTIRMYERGAIGPTDMWTPLFVTLTGETAGAFLESLPDDLKVLICREYFGLAHYRFQSPEWTADLHVAKAIAQWCERQGDPDALPEP